MSVSYTTPDELFTFTHAGDDLYLFVFALDERVHGSRYGSLPLGAKYMSSRFSKEMEPVYVDKINTILLYQLPSHPAIPANWRDKLIEMRDKLSWLANCSSTDE